MLTLRQLSLVTFGTVLIILQTDSTAQAIVAFNEQKISVDTDAISLNSSIQHNLKSYCSEHPYHISCENNFSKSPTYSSQFIFDPLAIPLTNTVKVSRTKNFIAPKSSNNNKNVTNLKLTNSPSIKIEQYNLAQKNNQKNLNNTIIKATKSISISKNSIYSSQNKEANINLSNYSKDNHLNTFSLKNNTEVTQLSSESQSFRRGLALPNLYKDKEQIIVSKPSSNRSNKGYTPTSRQTSQNPPPSSGMGGTRGVADKLQELNSFTLDCADCGVVNTAKSAGVGVILASSGGYTRPIVPLIAGTSLTSPINTNIFPPPPMLTSSLISAEDSIFIPPALREDVISIPPVQTDSTRDTSNNSPALDSRRIPEPTSGIGTFALVILSGYLLLKRKK